MFIVEVIFLYVGEQAERPYDVREFINANDAFHWKRENFLKIKKELERNGQLSNFWYLANSEIIEDRDGNLFIFRSYVED